MQTGEAAPDQVTTVPDEVAPVPEQVMPVPAEPELGFRTLWILVGWYLLSLLAVGMLWGALMMGVKGSPEAPLVLAWQKPINQLLTPAILLWILFDEPLTRRIRLWSKAELRWPALLAPVAAGVGYQVLVIGVTLLFIQHAGYRPPATPGLVQGLPPGLLPPVLSAVGLCLLTPVAEEWLFRGLVQRVLVRRWGPVAGVGVTALLFVLLHPWNLRTFLAIGGLGLLLGVLAHRRQSLTYSILLHAGFNLVAVSLGLLREIYL